MDDAPAASGRLLMLKTTARWLLCHAFSVLPADAAGRPEHTRADETKNNFRENYEKVKIPA